MSERGTNDEGNVVKISSKGKLKQGKEGKYSHAEICLLWKIMVVFCFLKNK